MNYRLLIFINIPCLKNDPINSFCVNAVSIVMNNKIDVKNQETFKRASKTCSKRASKRAFLLQYKNIFTKNSIPNNASIQFFHIQLVHVK